VAVVSVIYRRELWQDHEILDAIRAWAEEHGQPPTGLNWRCAGYGHPSVVTVREHFGTMEAAVRMAGFNVDRTPGYPVYWTRDRIALAMLDFLFAHGRWPTEREWMRGHGGARTGGAHRPSTTTVRRVFGTWNAAKTYAGWVEEPERTKPVPEGWRCAGCGCDDPNTKTVSCAQCHERHKKRRQRRALAPSPAPETAVSREGTSLSTSAQEVAA
jgi:hypothetical protein